MGSLKQGLISKFCHNMDLWKPFGSPLKIAVAISGGCDSTALLYLTNYWIKPFQGEVIALTIDHKLRPESSKEAEQVGVLCKNLGIRHHTIVWHHDLDIKNIQAEARIARYRLLTNFCKENNITHLLTGHQMLDRVEKFFIRILRGSGIFGLSDSHIFYFNNIRILRPLFNFNKKEIMGLLKENNLSWQDDPSNSLKKYLRNEIRDKLNDFTNLRNMPQDFAYSRIISTVDNISSSWETLKDKCLEFLALNSTIYEEGYCELPLKNIRDFKKEEVIIALSHLLTMVSGKFYQPRYESIIHLYDYLFFTDKLWVKTLHGCLIKKKKSGSVIIYREFGKEPPERKVLQSGVLWDNRFKFQFLGKASSDITVDLINKQEFQFLIEKLNTKIPKEIIFTLPCIKNLEKIVAVPHINYYNNEERQLENLQGLTVTFEPLFISRLNHFCH